MRYVAAHAEATHHVDKLAGGWYDSQLTPSGEGAAAAIAARLRKVIPAGSGVELYSSDLRRAVQTATPVSEILGVPLITDQRLRGSAVPGPGAPASSRAALAAAAHRSGP